MDDLVHKGRVLYLSGDEATKWGLSHGQDVKVRFGCDLAQGTLFVRETGGGLRLSRALQVRLHCPSSYQGKLVYHKELNEVQIGPLIGFLTVGLSGKGVIQDTALYRGLRREAKAMGAYIYAFSLKDIDWSLRVVSGRVEGGDDTKQRILPLPDVIYNRVPNRTLERTPQYRRFLRQVAGEKHIYMFNPHFFDKWQVHRWLSSVHEARRHLPETRLFAGVGDLERILLRHGHAYVKPLGGSLGKGIFRVARRRDGGFTVSYRTGEQNVLHHHPNFAQAASEVYAAKHRRRYLVQQGLTLAKYRGRVFDVRVTLHRNGKGEWEVVGPAAKVAAIGAVTTHVHNGGRVYPLKKVLSEVFPGDESAAYERVLEASKKVAYAVDKTSGLRLGELGLDLGITPEGEVYLFEVNARPGRMVFAPFWARKDNRRSLHCLCSFAHFAAGFGPIS